MEQEDRRFHLTYAALLVCSFLVDPFCRSLSAGWRSPSLHVYPAAVALFWLALWGRRRFTAEAGRRRALEERLKRLERRVNELEMEREK